MSLDGGSLSTELTNIQADFNSLTARAQAVIAGLGAGLASGTTPVSNGGPSRLLYMDESDVLKASEGFFVNDTNGVIAVNYPGAGSSCGFFIMPNGSVKSNTESGPWLGGMIYGGIGGPGVGLFGESGEPEFYIKNSAYTSGGIPDSAFVFGRGGVIGTCRLVVRGLTNDQTSYAFAVQDRDAVRNIFLVRSDGSVTFQAVNTAPGTTGTQTINTPSGKVNIAAGQSTITVNNPLCQLGSIVFAVILTNDTTSKIKNVVPGTNNFVIHLEANATAETAIGFLVINL
jgi:hypothetical protein